MHSFKPMGDETLYHELPPYTYIHIHTDTYLHIHRFKKVILASIYPKEMFTVLATYLIIQRVIITHSVFPCLLSQPQASPLRAAKPPSFHASMWYGDS